MFIDKINKIAYRTDLYFHADRYNIVRFDRNSNRNRTSI